MSKNPDPRRTGDEGRTGVQDLAETSSATDVRDADASAAAHGDQAGHGATDHADHADHSRHRRSSALGAVWRTIREIVVIVVIALVASALLRAFVIQAFFVPSGSMLPAIELNDRILVSQIGEIERGEVVVFEDPGGWIPSVERQAPPGPIREAFEFIGVLPASGHEHLVKRVIGMPGDRVVCCDRSGKLTINGQAVDESAFISEDGLGADNVKFDVTVPADHIFVLGDNRYISGDSSRHLTGQDAFVPMDLVTGRAFTVVWPASNADILEVPDAYDDVPAGQVPPDKGVIRTGSPGPR